MRLTPWASPIHNFTCVPRVGGICKHSLDNFTIIVWSRGRGSVSYRKLIQEVLTTFATRHRYQNNNSKKFIKSFANTKPEGCISQLTCLLPYVPSLHSIVWID